MEKDTQYAMTVSGFIKEIAEASEEQAQGITQVMAELAGMEKAMQAGLVNAGIIDDGATRLVSQIRNMRETLRRLFVQIHPPPKNFSHNSIKKQQKTIMLENWIWNERKSWQYLQMTQTSRERLRAARTPKFQEYI